MVPVQWHYTDFHLHSTSERVRHDVPLQHLSCMQVPLANRFIIPPQSHSSPGSTRLFPQRLSASTKQGRLSSGSGNINERNISTILLLLQTWHVLRVESELTSSMWATQDHSHQSSLSGFNRTTFLLAHGLLGITKYSQCPWDTHSVVITCWNLIRDGCKQCRRTSSEPSSNFLFFKAND